MENCLFLIYSLDYENLRTTMLQHLMILSPMGPCFIHRSYSHAKVDPQVISGLVAAHESSMKFMGIANILKAELGSEENLDVEIRKHYNYIAAAISSGKTDREKLKTALDKVNQLTYEAFGNPQKLYSIDTDKIQQIERKIDILLTKEGVL